MNYLPDKIESGSELDKAIKDCYKKYHLQPSDNIYNYCISLTYYIDHEAILATFSETAVRNVYYNCEACLYKQERDGWVMKDRIINEI